MSDPSEQLATLRALVDSATQSLLGDTIGVPEEDWRAPSRLPNWTRGHVVSHLARQADALSNLVSWARTGERTDMYASAEVREADIEAGSARSGLELQVDLDTSAERLEEGFASLDEADSWQSEVELRDGQRVAARLLPLARLSEVVLHHVDLGIGFGVDDIDAETAEWLLEWTSYRLGARAEIPRLDLTADSGFHTVIGSVGEVRTVRGPAPLLLGWLTGRSAPDAGQGADGLVLPGL
ncbi:MAG: maleylpyruvate isomerase family mycothiol-dependent enzyme [Microlunatus sp.]|nr:maleylpyruvate isomerase family mycothiol-dependent enzyme [Microlunatus sp.]